MKKDSKTYYSDELINTSWLGEVVDIDDPLYEGRIKIKVFGKFDELETDDIPWANPRNNFSAGSQTGSGSYSVPKLNSIVSVKFNNGNIYQPEYSFNERISDELKNEVSNNPENFHSLLFDTIENLKLFFSKDKGFLMTLDESLINILTDNTIKLESKKGKIIHIQKDKISIGSADKSDEPAVLGDKNATALNEISDQIISLCTSIVTANNILTTTVFTNVPILAPLAAAWTPLSIQAQTIKSLLQSKTKKVTIPQTRSSQVTLDGPPLNS